MRASMNMPKLSVRLLALILSGLLLPWFLNGAAPSIHGLSATPSWVKLKEQTLVTFTAVITDPSVILSEGGVTLQRQAANGATFSTAGSLYDDGTHGDAVAGDKTFSLQLS